MTNDTDATELTETKPTSETTRVTHLVRLNEIMFLLGGLRAGASDNCNEREARRLSELAASLKWLIAREKERS